MTPEAAEALEKSIRHWQENVVEADCMIIGISPDSCALCRLYYDFESGCSLDCPVKAKTGYRHCLRTPYAKAARVLRSWRYGTDKERAQWVEAAQAELDFLLSLREPAP